MKARTIAQRSSMTTTNPRTNHVSVRSSEITQSSRPRVAEAMLQGISARHSAASNVPTALARREFHKSPCISSAKLVVIPHDGHGRPVKR